MNAEDIEKGIIIKLGGKAALDLYGISDVGALIDVNKAISMANEMVSSAATEGFEYISLEDESEQRKQEREQMVNDKLNEYYSEAKTILTEHKPFLDFLAYELYKRGELSGNEVR